MIETTNARAVQAAQDLIAWGQSLENLLIAGRALSTRITDANFQPTWNAMATYTAGADGTQPTSNDPSPNAAHPIAGLNVSAASLQGLSYMVNDFLTFMTSTTTSPPQQNRESTIQTSIA